jgi:hypothetical protein
MKNLFMLIPLVLGTAAFGAQEANPFSIEWTCQETPSCSTDDGNYESGYAVIGSTYYVDSGSPASCCHIGKNIWDSACKDGENPKGAKVRCQ